MPSATLEDELYPDDNAAPEGEASIHQQHRKVLFTFRRLSFDRFRYI